MIAHGSILFGPAEAPAPSFEQDDDVLRDLNIDQIIEGIVPGRDEYDLRPFLLTPTRDIGLVHYRHDVLRDLEDGPLFAGVRSFADEMRRMRRCLVQENKLRYRYQQLRWFADGVARYCGAVNLLVETLAGANLRSRGFRDLHDHVTAYGRSEAFNALLAESKQVAAGLDVIRYNLHISSGRIRVTRHEGEEDYGAEIEGTFAKFAQGAAKSHRFAFPSYPEVNHLEEAVLGLVSRLYPDEFAALDEFCTIHRDFLDPAIAAFDREVQFYLAYLEYIEPLQRAGLPFCQPEMTEQSGDLVATESFDLALAKKLNAQETSVVRNDFALHDRERILVVTGPNQGGKTTFARMVGQLHYLASLGLPVPGARAKLLAFDRLFTHFDRAEDPGALTGKLEDDLLRIHRILAEATPRSVVIMNESFSSTTVDDSLFLGRQVLDQLIGRDVFGVYVTFLDELASLGSATVSMVSEVDPVDLTRRTFKITRRAADGLAYALAIAQKHGVTYERIVERMAA